jgi:hypothetical protein
MKPSEIRWKGENFIAGTSYIQGHHLLDQSLAKVLTEVKDRSFTKLLYGPMSNEQGACEGARSAKKRREAAQ